MQNVISEHQKEDITLIRIEKINQGHKYRILDDVRKQLEKFSLNFSSCIHFHPGHLQPKTLINSFIVLTQHLLIKMGHYFKISSGTMYILAVQRDAKNP